MNPKNFRGKKSGFFGDPNFFPLDLFSSTHMEKGVGPPLTETDKVLRFSSTGPQCTNLRLQTLSHVNHTIGCREIVIFQWMMIVDIVVVFIAKRSPSSS